MVRLERGMYAVDVNVSVRETKAKAKASENGVPSYSPPAPPIVPIILVLTP